MEELIYRSIGSQSKTLQEEYEVTLEITLDVQKQLEKLGYSAEYGARYLQKTVEEEIMANIASWLMGNDDRIQDGDRLVVTQLKSENTEFSLSINAPQL